MPGFSTLQTHGFLNENNPDMSGLLLSPVLDDEEDGILYSAETYGLNLQAELLVLSSCESGLGPLVKGEGVMALTRGFLFSGAENVMISLWKISDQQTRLLMENYYREHMKSEAATTGNYAAALREAKLQMINNQAQALPRNWAGFVLIGY